MVRGYTAGVEVSVSSDNYLARILSVDGPRLTLRATATGNAGFEGIHHPGGRSFFLLFAWESAPEDAPLRAILPSIDPLLDARWLAQHLDRFVLSAETSVVRVLSGDDDDAARFGSWLWESAYGDGATADPEALYEAHAPGFTASATFADPAWIAHLRPGSLLGTIAWSAWSEPPSARWRVDWQVEPIALTPNGRPA